jgi:uncharacterized Zn-binding protein involved in type VI secretion
MSGCDGVIESEVASSVLINGIPAAVKGSMSSDHSPYGPPHPPHVPNPIVAGSGSVMIEGKPAARVGDMFSCGHDVASGSGDVMIGD